MSDKEPIRARIDIGNLLDLIDDFENHDQPENYENLGEAIDKASVALPECKVGPSVDIILTVVREPYNEPE